MDREDKRRYLIVGSVILEIVSPLLRKRIEDGYKSKGFGCLQNFIHSLPVKHTLFHLRHKNSQCCVDEAHCFNLGPLPLNYSQWKRLYAEDHGQKGHHCHCKYTAKPISLNDLDITLASLILLNCFSLTPNEYTLISDLREFKNNYLSHNTDGSISETEYNTLWKDLKTYVQQLDPSKEDDLVIVQNRPLDESLCEKYVTCLLDVHVILQKIDTKIDATSAEIRTTIGNSNTEVMETIGTKSAELLATIGINNVVLMAKIEEVLQNIICQRFERNIYEQDKQKGPIQPYKLGQYIFTLHHQTNLKTVLVNHTNSANDTTSPYFDINDCLCGMIRRVVPVIVMMDDGRLVICLPYQNRLLICNTDGSPADRIHVQGLPWCVTAVNNSTVAVTLGASKCIEMYDIKNKLKLKSISVPGMWWGRGITTINNKLVVCVDNTLQIINHQTGEIVQTIQTNREPDKLHGSGDRIFYSYYNNNNKKLRWYSYTDERHHTLTLPSRPMSMTTLQDGSLYVVCKDKSVQHVSSDVKQYKSVKTTGLKKLNSSGISYNSKQRKLATISDMIGNVNVFCAK